MIIKRKNDDTYILADSDNINGKQIYHFINTKIVEYWNSDDNAKSLNEKDLPVFSMFCTKENDKFVEVEDSEKIKNLLDEFGMLLGSMIANDENSDIGDTNNSNQKVSKPKFKLTKVNSNVRKNFILEQEENLKGIKEKLGAPIDLNQINKKLSNIKVNVIDGIVPYGLDAFYRPKNGDVNFQYHTIVKQKTGSAKKRLHETVHYLAGKRYTKINYFSKALLEGMNENVVCDFYDSGISSINIAKDTNQNNDQNIKQASIKYNFESKSIYNFYICMVKQLEYIIGMKSYDSAINGNSKFLKAIIKELGPIDTIIMFAKLNRLLSNQIKAKEIKVELVEKFKQIQDDLFKKCFDKRFRMINNLEDAKRYMELLRNFETYRGKVTYLNQDGTIKEDNTFRKYYEEKYQNIINQFKDKTGDLDEYKYKEQEYRDFADQNPKYRRNTIKNNMLSIIITDSQGNLDSIPRNIQISMKRNGDFYFIYNINGNQINSDEIEKYSYIGQNRYLEWESIKLRNPNCSFIEQCSKFIDDMYNKGRKFEDETLDINYTEEEIQNEYRAFEEQEKMEEQMQGKKRETNQLKKITFIDKIRNKINSILNRRKNRRDESDTSKELPTAENKENEENEKLSSWDLRNWSNEEIIDSVMREYEQRKKANQNLPEKNEHNSPSDEYYK